MGVCVEQSSQAVISDVEPYVQRISVLHDIVPPLESQAPHLARGRQGSCRVQIVEPHHLCPYEPLGHVSMDLACSVERRLTSLQRPGTHLVPAGRGEEGDQVEERVSRRDKAL